MSSTEQMDAAHGMDTAFIERVVERWRCATMGNRRQAAEGVTEPGKTAGSSASEARAQLQQDGSCLRREAPRDRQGRCDTSLTRHQSA